MNSELLEHCYWRWGVPQTKEQSFNFFLMWGFLFLGHETIAWHQALLWGIIKDKKWGETATKTAVKPAETEWCAYSLFQIARLLPGSPLFTDFSFLPFFLLGSLIPGHETAAEWIVLLTLSSACAQNIILAGKCDSCHHSTMNFSENVVVAKTSYQMLEIWSYSDWEI